MKEKNNVSFFIVGTLFGMVISTAAICFYSFSSNYSKIYVDEHAKHYNKLEEHIPITHKENVNKVISPVVKDENSMVDEDNVAKSENKDKDDVLSKEDGSIEEILKKRAFEKMTPEEQQKAQKIEQEVKKSANDFYRKQAIMNISKKVEDFSIQFHAYTENPKANLFAFIDPECPKCKKLFSDVEKLRIKGYNLFFLPIPRDGMTSNIVDQLVAVQCASSNDEKVNLLTSLFDGKKIDESKNNEMCLAQINNFFNLALNLDDGNHKIEDFRAQGTPFLFTNEGNYTNGYSSIDSMIESLNL